MTEVSHWIVLHHATNAVFVHTHAHAHWHPNAATYSIAVVNHALTPKISIAVVEYARMPMVTLNARVRALITFVGTALVLIPDSTFLPQGDFQMRRKKLL